MEIFGPYSRIAEEIDRQAAEIISSLPAGESFREICRNILGMIDLTTLEGTDHDARIRDLCQQARFSSLSPGFPNAAAVCVYPNFIRTARANLAGSGIKIASVAGAFPSGQTSLMVKIAEVAYVVNEGADEIDTVISRGLLLAGRMTEVFDEIAAIRETAGKCRLKVILETGELQSVAPIRKAAEIAIIAGADFIKTSTGKSVTGSTHRAMLIMLDTIREFHEKTGKAIGIKPAGGIREPGQAVEHYWLVNHLLGPQWLDKNYFRIGASSLATRILEELA